MRGHAGEALAGSDLVRKLAAVALDEQGLAVEQVELGGAAGLEQIDDTLGLGGEVWRAGQQRLPGGATDTRTERAGEQACRAQHAQQTQTRDATGRVPQECSAACVVVSQR